MGYQVTGIDSSSKTIEAARSNNLHPNVIFKVVEAGTLQPEPSAYAAIICSEVLEHLSNPRELLSVLHRSLKDDGILIVTVPNGKGPRELFVTKPVQFLQKNSKGTWRILSSIKKLLGFHGTTVQSSADDLTHLQFFTVNSLRELALSAGFCIMLIKKSNFIEQVFPFSILFRQSTRLQRFDSMLADKLPLRFTSGFMTIWKKL
jgi:SAM-dependent methyltransferase